MEKRQFCLGKTLKFLFWSVVVICALCGVGYLITNVTTLSTRELSSFETLISYIPLGIIGIVAFVLAGMFIIVFAMGIYIAVTVEKPNEKA